MSATAHTHSHPHQREPLYEGLNRAEGELFTCKRSDIAASPALALTASRLAVAGRARALLGWSLAETTGLNTAAVRLRDGTTANNSVLARINLAANESDRDFFSPYGIEVVTGNIFLEWLSGSVEGVIYWI